MRRLFASCVAPLFLSALLPLQAVAAGVTVFAAASLKESLDAVARKFEADTGNKVIVSYAASSALAKQIESGAPADIFISADLDWADYLDQRKLLTPGSRANLLRNDLVLIAPAASAISVKLAPGLDLAAVLGNERLAIANPDAVPAGKYAKAALQVLGAWQGVETRLARAENVRAALLLVSRGETQLGIVYATDAFADKGVRIAATFPAGTHPPIVYPAALVAGGKSPAAGALMTFMAKPETRTIWERFGFKAAQ